MEIQPLQSHVEWIPVPDSFKKSLLVEGEMIKHVKITNGLYDAKDGRVRFLLTKKGIKFSMKKENMWLW